LAYLAVKTSRPVSWTF